MGQNDERPWEPSDFSRRDYTISGPSLDRAKSIRVQVIVDGQKQIDFALQEPGMVCLVSRPDEQGITVELVEPVAQRVTDQDERPGQRRAPRDWQLAALLEPK